MTKKIIRLNASALKDSSCFLRLWLTAIEGYGTKGGNWNDVEYGQAFHKFAASLDQTGGDLLKSMSVAQLYYKRIEMNVKPKKDWMTVIHLTKTCIDFYEKEWKSKLAAECVKSDDGIPLIEEQFSIPYYSDDSVEVLIEGTIDRKSKIAGGCYCIDDYKTTSAWNKAEYFEQYELSPQLMLYVWAIQWFAKNGAPGNVYTRMCEKRLGARVHGVFLSSSKDTEFETSRVFMFSEEQMQQFELSLFLTLNKITDFLKMQKVYGTLPLREGLFNGACKTEWGLCKYAPVCKMPSSEGMLAMLNGHYIKTEYRPLKEK